MGTHQKDFKKKKGHLGVLHGQNLRQQCSKTNDREREWALQLSVTVVETERDWGP